MPSEKHFGGFLSFHFVALELISCCSSLSDSFPHSGGSEQHIYCTGRELKKKLNPRQRIKLLKKTLKKPGNLNMKMKMQKSNLTTKEITLFQAIPYFS